jgi:hypothetical protein
MAGDRGMTNASPNLGNRRKGAPSIELTIFANEDAKLTKRIKLDKDGKLDITPATAMSRGTARRVAIGSVHDLAEVIEGLADNEAITLGVLRDELPDRVKVVRADQLNGGAGTIARTREHVVYREDRSALVLFDFDTKGMPTDVVVKDFWKTLVEVLPGLRHAAHVVRRSTSSSIRRTDTGEELPGSSGVHIYVPILDGTDAERFLKTLHQRCWLNGFGWIMISKAGTMLERSIIDRFVHASERLIFEAPPILKKPLVQDAESRRPIAVKGDVINSWTDCPDLTDAEQKQLDKLLDDARKKMEPEAAKVRAAYIEERAKALVKSRGITKEEAVQVIENACRQVLLPDFVLEFADKSLKGCTVLDVLDDPERFKDKPLADPIEGTDYGKQTAKILLTQDLDRTPWIKSFAHGGVKYSLLREPPKEKPSDLKKSLMQSSAEFVAGFIPPDYLIDGLLQRCYVYSFTGPTNSGKTAIALLIALCVALGLDLAGRAVEKGRVLFFAGENPDDVRSRWIKLCEAIHVDPASVDVVFMPHTVHLSDSKIRKQIDEAAEERGPFSLLVVDTSASYYSGDDENDNVQLGDHARMLRTFVDLPGGPTILVTCHPAKNPDMTNLIPRGGGAFLAEVDGNLVALKEKGAMVVEITTHGKWRGPEFSPFPFKLVTADSDKLVDSKGRKIYTVYAESISNEEQDDIEKQGRSNQDELLQTMLEHPGLSMNELAKKLGWKTVDGRTNKRRVQIDIEALRKSKLVEHRRDGHYALTSKGEQEANKISEGVSTKVKGKGSKIRFADTTPKPQKPTRKPKKPSRRKRR